MDNPLIEIIAVTYDHGFKLKCFIDCIRSQTYKNWALHIIHDGEGEMFNSLKEDLTKNGYLDDDNIVLSSTKERHNLWGHPSRDYGLSNRISNAPLITITNCDNYYVPVWLEEVNEVYNTDIELIYWDCVHNHTNRNFDRADGYGLMTTNVETNFMDIGSFAVNAEVAIKAGFKWTRSAADRDYLRVCRQLIEQSKILKLKKILFIHN